MTDDLKTILTSIQNDVKDIQATQSKQTKILDEHSDKLDALLGDMIDVQASTKATYDLVKATHENNRREIDEIKEHLGLPINPSPFK